jgi:hypothetical protein
MRRDLITLVSRGRGVTLWLLGDGSRLRSGEPSSFVELG